MIWNAGDQLLELCKSVFYNRKNYSREAEFTDSTKKQEKVFLDCVTMKNREELIGILEDSEVIKDGHAKPDSSEPGKKRKTETGGITVSKEEQE